MSNVRVSDLAAASLPLSPSSLLLVEPPDATSPTGFSSRQATLASVRGTPGTDFAWPTADIDLNFAEQQYGEISCSRASVGYVNDSLGNWLPVPINHVRGYPYTDLGALVEEARTNGVRNNSMQGAVTGSPGTLPTNWAQNINAGITRTINAVGTSLGIDYIEVRLQGTISGGGLQTIWAIFFDGGTQIAATVGQVWSNSAFAAMTAGSVSGITLAAAIWIENNSGGTFLTQHNSLNFVGSLTSALQRFSISDTNTNASTAFVRPGVGLQGNSGSVIDITLRIGWPQMELGSWVTSPIRTTTVAVTRAADVPTYALPLGFGSGVTLIAAGTPQAPAAYGTSQVLVQVDDGTANDRVTMQRDTSTGNAAWAVLDGGASQAGASLSAWSQSVAGALSVAAKVNNFSASFNGGTLSSDSSGTMPTVTTVHIGCDASGASQWNGFISRVLIYPEDRLGDQLVQAVAAALPSWVKVPVTFGSLVAGTYDGSGFLPPSTSTAGWAITNNYSGNDVGIWNTLDADPASSGVAFYQKLSSSTAARLAVIFGDSTFGQMSVGTTSGGILLYADATLASVESDNVPLQFLADGTLLAQGYTNGDLRQGSGLALATNATGGFFMVAPCAGTPTGAPTNAGAGQIPMIYDTTANKIWFYNSSWRGVAVT